MFLENIGMYTVVDVSEGKRHDAAILGDFTSWTAHVPVRESCLSPEDPLAGTIQGCKAYP